MDLYADLMTNSAQVWGWVGIAASLLLLLYFVTKAPDCLWPFFICWALRVAYCFYNTYIYTLPVDPFEPEAAVLSILPLHTIMGTFGSNSIFYTWFCAMVYYFFGRSPLLLQAINIMFCVVIAWNIYQISRRMAGPRAGHLATWSFALFPASIIFSTVVLREALCIFALTSGVYQWVRSIERGNLVRYLLAIAFFLLAAQTHYGCIVLVLGLALVPMLRWFGPERGRARGRLYSLGLLFMTALLLAGLFYGGLFEKIAPRLNLEDLSASDIGLGLESAARNRAAYLTGLQTNSLVDMIWQWPIRAVFFLFVPFPWMIRTTQDILGFVDTLFYWASFYILWKRRKLIVYDLRALGCLMFFALGLAMFCMGTSNYGTAMRHRGKFFPVLVCAVAYVWVLDERNKRMATEAKVAARRRPARADSGNAGAIN